MNKLKMLDRTLNACGVVTKKQAASLLEGKPANDIFSKKFLEKHPNLEGICAFRAGNKNASYFLSLMPVSKNFFNNSVTPKPLSVCYSVRENIAKTVVGGTLIFTGLTSIEAVPEQIKSAVTSLFSILHAYSSGGAGLFSNITQSLLLSTMIATAVYLNYIAVSFNIYAKDETFDPDITKKGIIFRTPPEIRDLMQRIKIRP